MSSGQISILFMQLLRHAEVPGVTFMLAPDLRDIGLSRSIMEGLSVQHTQQTCPQRGYEVDAGNIIEVVNDHVTLYVFLFAGFDRRLEDVSIIEVLHRL